MLWHDIEDYMKGCNIYLALKIVKQKLYSDLQFLLVSIHCWKNLLMDFITDLSILTNWKGDSYDSILIIINWLTKMVYYNPVNIIIDAPSLKEIIINIVVKHHSLPDSIINNQGLLFISKFWWLLCYFLHINQKLFTAFYFKTDKQTKRQNSLMKAYLWAFVIFEQNNWAQFLPMVEFAYNNAKKF